MPTLTRGGVLAPPEASGCADRAVGGAAEAAFLAAVSEELSRARAKFPEVPVTLAALLEEAGELAHAIIEKPRAEVYGEAVQVAVMALRLAVEGDDSLEGFRALQGLDPLAAGS